MLNKRYLTIDSILAGVLFLLVLLMLMITSCKHDPMVLPNPAANNATTSGNGNNSGNGNQQSTCDPDSVYFQTQVLPILISNCAQSGCHTSADHKEGIVLDNYNNVMATANVIAGRADNSKLYKSLIKSNPDDRMPPAPSAALSSSQIDIIYKWINQGANNNECSNSCDTNNVTFSGTIFPIMQNSCVGCHTGNLPGGNINLSNYQNIAAVALSGRLMGSIKHDTGFQPMPRGGNKLPDCQIDQIRIWIQNGSIND